MTIPKVRVEHARAIAGRLRAEAALASRPGQMNRLESEADSVDLLADEIERLHHVIGEARRQVIELGKNVVVQATSPRPFPVADLLDVLERGSASHG